jgi:1-acyl-sn-glycerol-3-phosphate acyltransferase
MDGVFRERAEARSLAERLEGSAPAGPDATVDPAARPRAVITPIPAAPSDPRRRGNALTAALAGLVLRTAGWTIEGAVPVEPRLVAIVAPHTSNWDFLIGLLAMVSLRFGFSALAKDSLFWPPFGSIMRWAGCIPVNRRNAGGVVSGAIRALHESEGLILAVTPEGTRRKADGWKTGFQRIARGAGVPIWPTVIDYRTKVIRFHPVFHPTDDVEADVRTLQTLYSAEMALHPESY